MSAIKIADLDNAKRDVDHIADLAMSPELTATDRLGNTKKTWSGIKKQAQLDIDEAAAVAATAAAVEATAAAEGYRDEAELARDYSENARDDAVAAAGAIGPLEFYGTYAQALAAAAGARRLVEVAQDETREGARTRYWAEAGSLDFVVNLDQMRKDFAEPDGSTRMGFLQSGVGAAPRDVQTKLREISVSVNDYWPVAGTGGDDSLYLEIASACLVAMGGGVVRLKRGTTYKFTRLTLRSEVIFEGEGSGSTGLKVTDSSTLDSGISIGSAIRKMDDGQRVYRSGFRNLWIGSGNVGVAALETEFRNIVGLNLCACERTVLENVAFYGLGQGAIIFSRAEGGAEGLGFVNTTQDGNYNYGKNITVSSCGRYNPEEAAIWYKYKANSNKFYGVYFKPVQVAFSVPHGNDNAVFGGSVESSKSIAVLGGSVGASGNLFLGIRAEGLSGDAYVFLGKASNNTVFAGYHTGVAGRDFNLDAGPNNRVLSDGINWLRSVAFPPATNYSTLHNLGALRVTSINGDPDDPVWIKSKFYSTIGSHPYLGFYNDIVNGVSGTILGRLAWRNGDTSAGAAGVSAAVDAVLEDTSGGTGLGFHTGTGTTLAEKFRITASGVFRPTSDNAQAFGGPANRLSVLYAGTAAINTSDERSKQNIAELSDAEMRVAVRLKGLIRKYRFRDAALVKGEDARIHIGVIAQDVIAAFSAEGLDAFKYGLLCYDEWDEQVIEHESLYDHRPTGEFDGEGNEIYARTVIRAAWTEVIPSGNRYSVRYEEILVFIIAAL